MNHVGAELRFLLLCNTAVHKRVCLEKVLEERPRSWPLRHIVKEEEAEEAEEAARSSPAAVYILPSSHESSRSAVSLFFFFFSTPEPVRLPVAPAPGPAHCGSRSS